MTISPTLPSSGNKNSSKGGKRSLLFSAFTNFKSSSNSRLEKNFKKAISFSYYFIPNENNNNNQQEQKFDSLQKLIE
jgi:hypothetical protein